MNYIDTESRVKIDAEIPDRPEIKVGMIGIVESIDGLQANVMIPFDGKEHRARIFVGGLTLVNEIPISMIQT